MKEYYTCAEVATKYGVKKTTVWDWIREGKLDAVRIGGRYRIKEDALRKFEQRNG